MPTHQRHSRVALLPPPPLPGLHGCRIGDSPKAYACRNPHKNVDGTMRESRTVRGLRAKASK